MKHPKIEKVYQLAMMFQAVAEATNNKAPVDMGNYIVPTTEEEICKTPACHAGWFGVMVDSNKNRNDRYTAYTSRMAEFLGLEHWESLEDWAEEYPELWGNTEGRNMFSREEAFGVEEDGKITMKIIADHWYKVAMRLELREKYEQALREVTV